MSRHPSSIHVGKQIIAVGPGGQTAVPQNAKVIDCNNAYLMPGLADMHMHLRYNWKSDVWPVSPLKLYLANGVTTIRCFGSIGMSGRFGLAWRREIDAGRLVGPSILTSGPNLRGHFKKNPEHIVISHKFQGFDFIKIYSYITRDEYHTILSTAEKLDFYTAGHILFQVGLDGVLAGRMDQQVRESPAGPEQGGGDCFHRTRLETHDNPAVVFIITISGG